MEESDNISRKLPRQANIIMASSSEIHQDAMTATLFRVTTTMSAAIGKSAHAVTNNF